MGRTSSLDFNYPTYLCGGGKKKDRLFLGAFSVTFLVRTAPRELTRSGFCHVAAFGACFPVAFSAVIVPRIFLFCLSMLRRGLKYRGPSSVAICEEWIGSQSQPRRQLLFC